jgi:hypothetical protein
VTATGDAVVVKGRRRSGSAEKRGERILAVGWG